MAPETRTDDTLIEVHAEELVTEKHKVWATGFGVIAFLFAAFQLYTAGAGPYIALVQRAVHVGFALILCTMAYRMKMEKAAPQPLAGYLFDLLEIVAAVAITGYVVANVDRLIIRIGFANPSSTDIVLGYIMLFLVINASRKVVGWTFTWMILLFIAYALAGRWMPGLLSHGGFPPNDLAAMLLVNPLGIYGQITGTSANVIAIYCLFGAIMLRTGAAKAFLNLALMVAGRLAGGGAQVAVLASAMMGMVNGSAVANAATVGAFTIPMMVKRGYPRAFAAGVESAASSGGQMTPPIMGAGAFIMAEILGIPYLRIATMAALPAVLFYVGMMMVVYFEAKKWQLPRLSGADIPSWRDYWKELFLLLVPVTVLVTLIVMMFTPRFAAFWAVVLNVALFIGIAIPTGKHFSSKRVAKNLRTAGATLVAGMVEGGGTIATLGVLVAGAQIMVGTLGITGLALKLAQQVTRLDITYLFPLLFAAMIIGLVLGGPLPTVPTYLITAAVVVPLLTPFGLPPVLVHMFIFWYACFSGLTPPVYGPVYSSAVFAGAGVWDSGLQSMKCGFVAFTVPFVFVYNPEMLGLEGWGLAFEALAIGSVGALLAASALVGYWDRPLSIFQRALLAGGGILIVVPDLHARVAGMVLALGTGLLVWLSGRRVPLVQKVKDPPPQS